jgi:hypothetical protein
VWIFTKQGFISIKRHIDDPKKLLIRARVNGDLEKIFPGCKVSKNTGTDYKFRTTVDRAAAVSQIAKAVSDISYTEGFKTSVDDHDRRAPFYLRIWEMLVDMQETLSQKAHTGGNTNSQLEKDVSKKLHERLHTVATDHLNLCQIAEIGPPDGYSILFSVLARFLIQGLAATTHVTPDKFGATMAEALRKEVRNKKAQTRNT